MRWTRQPRHASQPVCSSHPRSTSAATSLARLFWRVILEGKTGAVWAMDADSAAPAAASPSMYRILPKNLAGKGPNENEYGCSVKDNANVDGALAVGVPSTLAGIGTLWERWGKLSWSQVV